MALKTLGTLATTTLSALVFQRGGLLTADVASIRANIKNDQQNTHPIYPGAFELGLLYIPNRGVLQLLPGDYVAYDAFGWPILVSGNSIASVSPASSWAHS